MRTSRTLAAQQRVAAELVDSPDRVAVNGDCMEPLLSDGELVQVDRRRPRCGDIVVFRSGGALLVHRYLGRRPWREARGRWKWLAVTKADRDLRCDPEVGARDMLGVVTLRLDSRGQPSKRIPVGVRRRTRAAIDFVRYCLRVLLRLASRRSDVARTP